MEHHLRDNQAEFVSFNLVTMELKLMAMTLMFLDVTVESQQLQLGT
jgi:hypothetical protein